MNNMIPDDVIYASFFFVDIVSLSNPILSTETQQTKIKMLNENIYNCKALIEFPEKDTFILPTGDGMLIAFKNGLEEPINLAMELQRSLSQYNKTIPETEKVGIRIGCNVGHVFLVNDVRGHVNLWGPGAILARRVMDLGDEGHILLTAQLADDLSEISEKYHKILHPIHDHKIKHGENILLYNLYDEGYGNSKIPKKMQNVVLSSDLSNENRNIVCEKIIFDVLLNNEKTNQVKQQIEYHIKNINIEPIYEFDMSILTNATQEFESLDMQILEDNNKIKPFKIWSPSYWSKHFTIKLSSPIFTNKSKVITIQYSSLGGKSFENILPFDCNDIVVNFTYSQNPEDESPRLFHFDFEKNVKTLEKQIVKNSKGMSSSIKWNIIRNVKRKDLLRLEW